MHKLVIKNVSKAYEIDKGKLFYALKDINLSFYDTGLIAIVGKSGSGKSTLLNLIARLDEPSGGDIYLDNKLYPKKKCDSSHFYKNDVGIVFQNYQLIDDKSALYNVALPLLISGHRKKKALDKAKKTLEYVGIEPKLYKLKASRLSGGEKQRVSIARAIAKNPLIILCDEPTGALDSKSSIVVMDLLKSISKDHLVIVVSHNLQLIDKYCDRKIELSDGKVIKDTIYTRHNEVIEKETKKHRNSGSWTSSFSLSNFKKRYKRNLFIIFALSISLIMGNLVFGFLYSKDNAIKNATFRQFDFGYGTICKEEMVSNTGILKLTKSVRPDLRELKKESNLNKLFEICPNFSTILPRNLQIRYDYSIMEELNFTPVYSFDSIYVDSSLIAIGQLPDIDSFSELVINRKCYNYLKGIIHKDPLNEWIDIYHRFDNNYVTEDGDYITDVFEFKTKSKIVGVVDELEYLATNKIYYPYTALETYMQEYQLNNLSTYFDNKITWYDYVMNAENYSIISAYSYQLFLKRYLDRTQLFDLDIVSSDYVYSSDSIVIANSLINFLQVAEYALFLFLGISLIGAILILSIISFTNFSEDRKISAILFSLGVRNSDIQDIYLSESLLCGCLSLIISLIAAYPLSLLVNNIIYKNLSIINIVQIPYLSLFGIPFLYPILLFLVVCLFISIATLIPISFSRHNSIRMELQAND